MTHKQAAHMYAHALLRGNHEDRESALKAIIKMGALLDTNIRERKRLESEVERLEEENNSNAFELGEANSRYKLLVSAIKHIKNAI